MEFANWVFFGPAKLVATWQYAGILIAVALIGMQAWFSWREGKLLERDFFRKAPVLAGLLWLIFNLYELQQAAVLAKVQASGTLRMDLIILVPFLYVLTFAAIWSIRTQLMHNRADR